MMVMVMWVWMHRFINLLSGYDDNKCSKAILEATHQCFACHSQRRFIVILGIKTPDLISERQHLSLTNSHNT